ncbi:MAG TPA: hypothetical protein VHZ09_00555 [Acidobacteriaceae bacterium]|jgi:hypothetical protein|nr:hypothetical protein [Acidobacteriaceae bacterium]
MRATTFEAVTAWAAIATAVGTLLGVYVAYRGIKGQAESFAKSVSADLALKLLREFDSAPSRTLRSDVANALLMRLGSSEAEDLFDKFGSIGLFVRKGFLDAAIAHSFFFHWVNLYWVAGQHLTDEKRKGASDLWTDFEFLYNRLLAIEMAKDSRSRYINPSEQLVRARHEEELA